MRPLRTLLHIGDSVLRNSSAGSQDFAVRHDIPFVSRCGDGVGLQDPHALAAVSGYLDRGRGAITSRRPRRSVVGAGKCYFGPVQLSGRHFCPQNLRTDWIFSSARHSPFAVAAICCDGSVSTVACRTLRPGLPCGQSTACSMPGPVPKKHACAQAGG